MVIDKSEEEARRPEDQPMAPDSSLSGTGMHNKARDPQSESTGGVSEDKMGLAWA